MRRYAIYHVPAGPLGAVGADWLGWDIRQGQTRPQPVLAGQDLSLRTERPRRYGFHATIKPPFALAAGRTAEELAEAFVAFCAGAAPVVLPALHPIWMGGFLALTVEGGDPPALGRLAADVVRGLDDFRAPLTAEELVRRDHPRLAEAERRNLYDWGYPHVLDRFRFHLTLTGRVPKEERDLIEAAATQRFRPQLPRPFEIAELSLVGEGMDGRFRELLRPPLGNGRP